MNKDFMEPIDPLEDKDVPDMGDENDENDEFDDSMLDETIEFVIEIDDDVKSFLKLDNENEIEEQLVDSDEEDILEEDILEEDVDFSKHKIQGKHSLKYDSIFKGKKEDPLTDEDFETTATYYNENFEVDKGSIYWFESMDNENYVKQKKVQEKVYEVLTTHTKLNFLNNRRKPSKSDFNNYYFLLKTHLKDEGFSNTEMFNELSVYFSDNYLNMLKLLDNKWRNLIFDELAEHTGKTRTNPEVSIRNISIDTEVEFIIFDELNEKKIITGVVKEIDDNIYIVDSYEKLYYLELDQISKILNNTKFKYNLNRLKNIDFL